MIPGISRDSRDYKPQISLPVAFSNSRSLPVKRECDLQFPVPGSQKFFPAHPCNVDAFFLANKWLTTCVKPPTPPIGWPFQGGTGGLFSDMMSTRLKTQLFILERLCNTLSIYFMICEIILQGQWKHNFGTFQFCGRSFATVALWTVGSPSTCLHVYMWLSIRSMLSILTPQPLHW